MKKTYAKNSQVYALTLIFISKIFILETHSLRVQSTIIIFSYGTEICPLLVQLIGHVSALIGYIEMKISHHTCSFEFANIFVMAYSRKIVFKCIKLLKKFLKNVYLLRKMQTILNVKTVNSRKQIFCQECESTLFVKTNLHKMQF